MFSVTVNNEHFEYDINAIVRAFYPEEQVSVLTPETGAEKREKWEPFVRMRIELDEPVARILAGEKSYVWEQPAQKDGQIGAQEKFKDGFKRFLYRVLREETGRDLPWGNLTGIRPTKIAYGMLAEGCGDEEILRFYEDRHYVSRQKAELAVAIAKRERDLLSGVHYEGGYSLYIGIPFCPSTCLYCSFTSYPIGACRKLVEPYLDCLLREMEYVSEAFAGQVLDCVYIGGGTPTTLEAEQLERLLKRLVELFDFSTVQEFTVEAGRADSITEGKLAVLRRYGVKRISVNPQTMKQETLDIIGRKADVGQVRRAYALAKEAGFENINMDLILGLPGEDAEDVRRTVDEVVRMAPDSLTVHSLAIKRASKLNQWIKEHGVSMLRNTDQTMELAAEGASQLGLVPYYLYRQKNMSGNFENVGYAAEGKLGLYNILIMEEVQSIVALGAGSITKRVIRQRTKEGEENVRIERCENVKEIAQYIARIDEMIERKKQLFESQIAYGNIPSAQSADRE